MQYAMYSFLNFVFFFFSWNLFLNGMNFTLLSLNNAIYIYIYIYIFSMDLEYINVFFLLMAVFVSWKHPL